MTLLELILACAIVIVLASAALPLQRYTLLRRREAELRADLREMREAIDRYKDYTDRGLVRKELDSEGYPPDLETLVKEIPIVNAGAASKNLRLMRRIPVDPFTGSADWGLRAVGDDPDSQNWGGKNVYDIYSKSTGTGLDGTKYSDW